MAKYCEKEKLEFSENMKADDTTLDWAKFSDGSLSNDGRWIFKHCSLPILLFIHLDLSSVSTLEQLIIMVGLCWKMDHHDLI